MKIICTDLDNTLIYSYKHDIGTDKRNVELYQGRELSFITNKTYALLQEIKKDYLIVPTTTRTIEQYERINLGIGDLSCALVCNGGVLLVNGKRDETWYKESKNLVKESRSVMTEAMKLLENDSRRCFELRFIEELFLFTKCEEAEQVTEDLRRELNTEAVRVFHNGSKVYVLPNTLSKGMAVKRLRERLQPEQIFAAGDSEFDRTLVCEADYGFVPYGFQKEFQTPDHVEEMNETTIFAEAYLEKIMEKTNREAVAK